MQLIDRHPQIDEVLEHWAPLLGAARAAYRGHAYRVYNFARRLQGSARWDAELALASAFHDLGIWSDQTFDYLAPSIARARDHLRSHSHVISEPLVVEAIAQHHRLRRIRNGTDAKLLEAFRCADLVDLSRGFIRAGLEPGFVRDVVAAFPYAGFHGVLLRTALDWSLRHPLRPLPMLRW